jgi:hypothetical protein
MLRCRRVNVWEVAAHAEGKGPISAPAPPALRAPQDGSNKPLQNRRDVNYCDMLLLSVWGEHSETHKWLHAGDGQCGSQWKSGQCPPGCSARAASVEIVQHATATRRT